MKTCKWLVVCGLCILPPFALAQLEHQPPSRESEDCSTLSASLRAIIGAMAHTDQKVDALEVRGTMSPLRPGSEPFMVTLQLAERVTLIAGNPAPVEKSLPVFAGLLPLIVQNDGHYRISINSQLWIDVLDGDAKVDRIKTKRLHCGPVQKSLIFPLKAGSYWLELSGSQSQEVAVMITAEREGR